MSNMNKTKRETTKNDLWTFCSSFSNNPCEKGISVERSEASALGKLTLTQYSGIMAKLLSNDC